MPNGAQDGSGGIAHLLPQSNPEFVDEIVEEALSDDESDSDSEDGEQEPEPLPDLVLGITRLPFYPNAKKGDVTTGTSLFPQDLHTMRVARVVC